ncbi:MAG TPA: aldehyde ferredoxin oxidoreductase, partial [Proteobacteria bacterium]|nr:aldehyde ferredoxin oxidoreductase [Pseudomonadota bacterium]
MAGGYMGKVLWVDLSNGTFEEEEIPEDIYRNFLTGYGLGAKLIYDRQKGKNIDPLGPDNILGFCSGLLTGTGAFFSGRWMVVGKSPLTGGWG